MKSKNITQETRPFCNKLRNLGNRKKQIEKMVNDDQNHFPDLELDLNGIFLLDAASEESFEDLS